MDNIVNVTASTSLLGENYTILGGDQAGFDKLVKEYGLFLSHQFRAFDIIRTELTTVIEKGNLTPEILDEFTKTRDAASDVADALNGLKAVSVAQGLFLSDNSKLSPQEQAIKDGLENNTLDEILASSDNELSALREFLT